MLRVPCRRVEVLEREEEALLDWDIVVDLCGRVVGHFVA